MNEKPRSRKRLYVLMTVAAIIIPGVLGYIEFYLSRPVGEGAAGPSIDASAFSQIWTERQVQLVGLGDSITAGLGAKSPSHTFFNRILENPNDEFAEMQGVCLSAVLPNMQSENSSLASPSRSGRVN